MKQLPGSAAPSWSILQNGLPGSDVFLLVPGLLQKGATAFLPLLPAFGPDDRVCAIDYGRGHFRHSAVKTMLQASVMFNAASGRRVSVIVGASLGGMLTAVAVAELLSELNHEEQERVSILFCDTPYDLSTAKQIPLWLNKPIAWLLRHWRVGVLAELIMNYTLMWFFGVNPAGLPKAAEITTPMYSRDMIAIQQAHGVRFPHVMSEQEWHQYIRGIAKDGLSGQSFAMWIGHAAFIEKAGAEWMDNALRRLGRSAVTMGYVVNDAGNVNVRQPDAVDAFTERIPSLNVLHVDGPHCGFAQNATLWWDVLGRFRATL